MTLFGEILLILGGLVALLAAIGLLRFETAYARFHAAGKASPVGFIIAAIGASIILGTDGAAYLMIAVVAMVLTVPVGVHLLFRAVYRNTTPTEGLTEDEASTRQRRTPSDSS